MIRVPYVKYKAQVEKVIEEAKENNGIICYTVVSPELREHIAHKAMEHDVEVVDVLGPMLKAIEKTSGLLPKNQAGLIHALDHEYFKRVEAVEFAVKYDDGKNPLGLAKADVVIIGVSRTSKTPLSMYLAHKQIKLPMYRWYRKSCLLKNYLKFLRIKSLACLLIRLNLMRSAANV